MSKRKNRTVGISEEAYDLLKRRAATAEVSMAVMFAQIITDADEPVRDAEPVPHPWSRNFLRLCQPTWTPWYRELEILSTLEPGEYPITQSFDRAKRFHCISSEGFSTLIGMFLPLYGIRTYEGKIIITHKPRLRWSKAHQIWTMLRSEGFDEDFCMSLVRRLINGK